MTSSEIRQSFLEFFKSKGHTVVPSSSLLPDAPNLLFTNAGMNQFVPIFLGQNKPQWNPPRTTDTQKCIRAGGKHNDLEDVGLDTYHHTFFEMLGNWSFGDYFKREAIDWAWELLVNVWKFPKERLYATYFGGDEKTPQDEEAKKHWLRHLPPDHVIAGSRKDNFWMMGDTGPCGPCSEIHMDLTPRGDGGPKLVNAGKPECIEIWNLVFIQFNANPDGSLTPLAAKHVDTGMGFERVCGIIQCTDGLKDFSKRISNYQSDVFTPIFRELEKLSGKKYTSTLPGDVGHSSSLSNSFSERPDKQDARSTQMDKQDARVTQVAVDIAFRVIADHIRCISFAIADGILPSNENRGHVLRGILRRAIVHGRKNLGLRDSFFWKLVYVVASEYAKVFPNVWERRERIEKIIRDEEAGFTRTLERGMVLLDRAMPQINAVKALLMSPSDRIFPAAEVFKLQATHGLPIEFIEQAVKEKGMKIDMAEVEKLDKEHRDRSRADYQRKKRRIQVHLDTTENTSTDFIGYDLENLESEAEITRVAESDGPDSYDIILDRTPFYAEMGGQVGDTGWMYLLTNEQTGCGRFEVLDTVRQEGQHVHKAELARGRIRDPHQGEAVRVAVDAARRGNIQRHHTVTHLFHWALHEVVNRDARQRGSLVAPDRLRFDFNHGEKLTDQQIADIERLVNERIKENARVFWFEMPYAEVRGKPDVMQFFGDKYGDVVRIVQIGGHDKALDGFSMELCGGTHTKTTGEIGLFKITKESAIAAGIRRVEAACGQFALEFLEKSNAEDAAEAERAKARERQKEEERQRKAESGKRAPEIAEQLLGRARPPGAPLIGEVLDANAELLRALVDALKPKVTSGVVVLGGSVEGKVALICYVTPDLVKQGKHAGKIVGELAKICGGGGGGRPDLAQAGGKQPEKLAEALAAAKQIIGS